MTTLLPCPVKSDSDKKEYRLIELSNGLKALLIDDSLIEHKEERMPACCLMVDVGSFHNPIEIPGLAHFLEHLMDMGSKKFPGENEYTAFLSKHGGSSNACTAYEETMYYFDVTEKYFVDALDRFTSFFTAPLLAKDTMDREREAVDSEFQTYINYEGSRTEQIIATFAKEGHPAGFFTTGNLKTLKENVSDDELHEKTNEFWMKHYSAHRMFVCIQANKPLDDLQALVEEYFLQIPVNYEPREDFKIENPFTDEFFSKVIYKKARGDVNQLDFTFVLPPMQEKYREKSKSYLSSVLGWEGQGSICSYLRRHHLASVCNAGSCGGYDDNSIYSHLNVQICLTDKGLDEIDEVIRVVFAFLRLLKHQLSHEECYNDCKQISDIKFKFTEEKSALCTVTDFVENLKYHDPKDVLGGPYLYYNFDEAEIKSIIDSFNARTFNIMLTTLKELTDKPFNLKEKWYGTEYGVHDYPKRWIELWESDEVIDSLHLPLKNDFIPSNFEILQHLDVPMYPGKIIDTEIIELWYRPDDKFQLPNAWCFFYLRSGIIQDVTSTFGLSLLSSILNFVLAENLYPAGEAGIEYMVYTEQFGLVLGATGFNEKLQVVFENIIESLLNLAELIDENLFKFLQIESKKDFSNATMCTMLANNDLTRMTLTKFHFTFNELAAQEMTFEEFKNFVNSFVQSLKIYGLVQGNIAQDTAMELGQKLVDSFNCSPAELVENQTYEVPIGEKYIKIKSFRPNDHNTSVLNFYQIGVYTFKLAAMADLLRFIMEEPVFDYLRTKEQLGYSVYATARNVCETIDYAIEVNSQENKFSAAIVEEKIEKFRQQFMDILNNMTESDFETRKDSLVKIKLEPDLRLSDEVHRNWDEICRTFYVFDRRHREVDAIRAVSREELVEFYKNLLENETRKISFQVIGVAEVEEGVESSTAKPVIEFIGGGQHCVLSLESFKEGLNLVPFQKI